MKLETTGKNGEQGQALVVVLVLAVISIIVISASTAITIITAQDAQTVLLAEDLYVAVESGIEEAVISLLREPSYTGGTVTQNDIDVNVVVTGTNPYVIEASAESAGIRRSIQAEGTIVNTVFTLTRWEEIP